MTVMITTADEDYITRQCGEFCTDMFDTGSLRVVLADASVRVDVFRVLSFSTDIARGLVRTYIHQNEWMPIFHICIFTQTQHVRTHAILCRTRLGEHIYSPEWMNTFIYTNTTCTHTCNILSHASWWAHIFTRMNECPFSRSYVYFLHKHNMYAHMQYYIARGLVSTYIHQNEWIRSYVYFLHKHNVYAHMQHIYSNKHTKALL